MSHAHEFGHVYTMIGRRCRIVMVRTNGGRKATVEVAAGVARYEAIPGAEPITLQPAE
jgi:hypothetical protein